MGAALPSLLSSSSSRTAVLNQAQSCPRRGQLPMSGDFFGGVSPLERRVLLNKAQHSPSHQRTLQPKKELSRAEVESSPSRNSAENGVYLVATQKYKKKEVNPPKSHYPDTTAVYFWVIFPPDFSLCTFTCRLAGMYNPTKTPSRGRCVLQTHPPFFHSETCHEHLCTVNTCRFVTSFLEVCVAFHSGDATLYLDNPLLMDI